MISSLIGGLLLVGPSLTSSVAASSIAVSASSSGSSSSSESSSIPSTGQDWISLDKEVEFQPSDISVSKRPESLRRAQRRFLGYYDDKFAESTETYYDEYSQAWRLLGMYIDCNPRSQYYYDQEERKLEDQHDEEENGENNRDDEGEGNGNGGQQRRCTRYLMWAAYVDLDYRGEANAEYMYYDRQNRRWDRTACKKHKKRRGCNKKLDCHLPNTNFELIGYFKEPQYDQWLEQVSTYQGACLWTDDEYQFMVYNDHSVWPNGCTDTGVQDSSGNDLYYDVRPSKQGRMDLGLYTDNKCSQDYTGVMSVETVLDRYQENENGNEQDGENNNGGGYEESWLSYGLSEYLKKWNDAMDIFHYCQPCKSFNLGYIPSSDYNQDLRLKNGGGDDDDDDGYFSCYENAAYSTANQCMKFRANTQMQGVTFNDLILANQQGTMNDLNFEKLTFESTAGLNFSLAVLLLSCCIFGLGIVAMYYAINKPEEASLFVEPLVSMGVAA